MSRHACQVAVLLLLPLAACVAGEPEGGAEDTAARLERLRSLPYADFAGAEAGESRDGVTRLDAERASPGYTLYTSRSFCLAELIDISGRTVNGWRVRPCRHWANAALLPGGDLLVVGADPVQDDSPRERTHGAYLLRLTWGGDVVFKSRLRAHHDAQPVPGDRFLALTAEHRMEPRFDGEKMIRDNVLTLVNSGGEVVEAASLFDSLWEAPGGFELRKTGVREKDGVEIIDLLHANTVEWMPHSRLEGLSPVHGPGNVMVTLRNQDTVLIVEWPTRRVLWTWGRGEISGPHDASWLENGNILIFDNGLDRERSRVVEVDPATRRIVWSYDAPELETFYTASRGGAQRLANGNTLITESDRGHLIEITGEGEIVWEFWNPNKNEEGQRASIFRARRYDAGSAYLSPLQAAAAPLP